MQLLPAVVLGAGLVLVATAARADWDDRRWPAGEIGLGGMVALPDGMGGGVGGGSSLLVGVHSVRSPYAEHHEKFDWPVEPGLRWCAPAACLLPLVMLFAPSDSLLGNEYGVDLRGQFLLSDLGTDFRIGAQPIFRYAAGRARTGTTLGIYLPEVSYVNRSRGHDALGLMWSVYPVDLLADGRHLAIGFDPLRAGFDMPLDGTRFAINARSEITVRWVR